MFWMTWKGRDLILAHTDLQGAYRNQGMSDQFSNTTRPKRAHVKGLFHRDMSIFVGWKLLGFGGLFVSCWLVGCFFGLSFVHLSGFGLFCCWFCVCFFVVLFLFFFSDICKVDIWLCQVLFSVFQKNICTGEGGGKSYKNKHRSFTKALIFDT